MQADGRQALAFEDFVQARSAGLFRTALLLTGQNAAEAKDLLQLCLERAYRHWHRIARQGGEPERYARRILVNAANDRWRRLGRGREDPLEAPGGGFVMPAVSDRTSQLADRDALVRALSDLVERVRRRHRRYRARGSSARAGSARAFMLAPVVAHQRAHHLCRSRQHEANGLRPAAR